MKKIFIPFNLKSIIVYLVMPYDETKFTVRKSIRDNVFKIKMYWLVTILVDHWELDTLGEFSQVRSVQIQAEIYQTSKEAVKRV